MTAEQFLTELERRRVLAPILLSAVRQKLAANVSPPPGKAVAKLLVDRGYLTKEMALSILRGGEIGGMLSNPGGVPTGAPVQGAPGSQFGGSLADLLGGPIEQPFDAPMADPLAGSGSFRGGPAQDSGFASGDMFGADSVLGPGLGAGQGSGMWPGANLPAAQPPRGPTPQPRPAMGPALVPMGQPAAIPAESAGPAGPKPGASKPKTNEFDSPLILIGSGSLLLLLLAGGAILYFLTRESAEQLLAAADGAFNSGSYAQSIDFYQNFLKSFPSDPGASRAKVQLVLAEVRQVIGEDDAEALKVAQLGLPLVEDEPAFDDQAKADLSSLLPKIADGLATEAEASSKADQVSELVKLSTEALALASNTKYVPKSLRDEGELESIRGVLDRIARRQKSMKSLRETLAAMASATQEGDIRGAYDKYSAFVRENPEQLFEGELAVALQAASKAEGALVRSEDIQKQAQQGDHATPVEAAVALVHRRVQGTAPAAGPIAIEFSGTLYGVDSKEGRLLWRRYVGRSEPAVGLVRGDDALFAWDANRKELLRLDPATGTLQWRLEVGEPIFTPARQGQTLAVTTPAGKLLVIDAQTGNQRKVVTLPQDISAPAAYNATGDRLFVVGRRSSIYTLSGDDFTCLGVYYAGQGVGAISTPPAAILDKVLIAENVGAQTSRVRVVGFGASGALERELASQRLVGLIDQPLVVFGRRLAVLSGRGEIAVLETTPGDKGAPLTLIAQRDPAREGEYIGPFTEHNNHLWIGGTGVTKHSIVPAGKRLPAITLAAPMTEDRFVGELLPVGDALIHARRRRDRPGVTLAAVDLSESDRAGSVFWETDLAAGPAGAPVAVADPPGIAVALSDGRVHLVDRQTLSKQFQEKPLGMQAVGAERFTSVSQLGGARFALSSAGGTRIATVDLANESAPITWGNLPSPLACEPVAAGDRWLAPLQLGQVMVLGSQGATPVAATFQPPLRPGDHPAWKKPAVQGDLVVLTDSAANIYTLRLGAAGLEQVARASVGASSILSGGACLEGLVAHATAAGELNLRTLPGLDRAGEAKLTGPAVWGPFAAGDRFLVATADELAAIGRDGEKLWQLPLNGRGLVGTPALETGAAVVATRSGSLIRVSLATGEKQAEEDVAQHLASGPTLVGGRTLVAAADGTLLVVRPAPTPDAP